MLPGFQHIHTLADDQLTVQYGRNGHSAALDFLLGGLPDIEEGLHRKRAESSQIGTAALFHHSLPEGILILRLTGAHQLADTAAAGHHGLLEQTAA